MPRANERGDSRSVVAADHGEFAAGVAARVEHARAEWFADGGDHSVRGWLLLPGVLAFLSGDAFRGNVSGARRIAGGTFAVSVVRVSVCVALLQQRRDQLLEFLPQSGKFVFDFAADF